MKLFISYSWDNDNHKNWVRQLAFDLIKNGVSVILDQYDLDIGQNMKKFMTESILRSDKVLIILTENYKSKAENLVGGAGYEYSILREDLYENIKRNTKFIPIIREGTIKSAMPAFLNAFLALEMSNDFDYEIQLEKLLRSLYGKKAYPKPNIGKKPDFSSTDSNILSSVITLASESSSLESYKKHILELAERNSEELFANSDRNHSIVVLETIFKLNINKSVTIYIQDTADELYDEEGYLDRLKDYASNISNKLIFIISEKSKFNESTSLGKLILALNSQDNVEVKILNKNIFPAYKNFTISDSKSFRIETVNQGEFNAIASFNNPSMVENLQKIFSGLFP